MPLHFPVEEEVPEGRRHLKLRTLLCQILELALQHHGTLGSGQFFYWNARNPDVRLAPGVFVALHVPDEDFSNWKTLGTEDPRTRGRNREPCGHV